MSATQPQQQAMNEVAPPQVKWRGIEPPRSYAELFHLKWSVSTAIAIAMLWFRSPFMIVLCVAALVNAVLSKVLKRIINQRRPPGAPELDPGMPSSHAQSLFFLASYLSIAAYTHHAHLPALFPILLSFFIDFSTSSLAHLAAFSLLTFAAAGSVGRVVRGFHTFPQVHVGALVGSLSAVGSFSLADAYIHPLLDGVLGWEWISMFALVVLITLGYFVLAVGRRSFFPRPSPSTRPLAPSSPLPSHDADTVTPTNQGA